MGLLVAIATAIIESNPTALVHNGADGARSWSGRWLG